MNIVYEKIVRSIVDLEEALNEGWCFMEEIEDGVYVVYDLKAKLETQEEVIRKWRQIDKIREKKTRRDRGRQP